MLTEGEELYASHHHHLIVILVKYTLVNNTCTKQYILTKSKCLSLFVHQNQSVMHHDGNLS